MIASPRSPHFLDTSDAPPTSHACLSQDTQLLDACLSQDTRLQDACLLQDTCLFPIPSHPCSSLPAMQSWNWSGTQIFLRECDTDPARVQEQDSRAQPMQEGRAYALNSTERIGHIVFPCCVVVFWTTKPWDIPCFCSLPCRLFGNCEIFMTPVRTAINSPCFEVYIHC